MRYTDDLHRKLDACPAPEDGDDKGCDWFKIASVLVRHAGLNPGGRQDIEGKIVYTEWRSSVSSSQRKWNNRTGTYERDWYRDRYEYEKTVLRPARELLVIDIGHPGMLIQVEIAATNTTKRMHVGEPIALRGLVTDPVHDWFPSGIKGRYRNWACVGILKPRVDRKQTKVLRALNLVGEHALKPYPNGTKRTLAELMRAGARKDSPISAAVLDSLDNGKMHLVYKDYNDVRLDFRRREPDGPGVQTIGDATSYLVRCGGSYRALYSFSEGPPPKGDFANPWTAEETVQGLAKRGDWVTSNDTRRDREGPDCLDVSSLGLHVGIAGSVWNFWIVPNARGWDQEAKRFREMCLRFDILFKEDHPRVEIDIDANEVRYLLGERLLHKLSYTVSNEERVIEHAYGCFKGKLEPDDIRTIVTWTWQRTKRDLNKRFKDAGLLHLVPHLMSDGEEA